MAGVELEVQRGNSDGSEAGQQLFSCADGHGVFVYPDEITPIPFGLQGLAQSGATYTLELVLSHRTDRHSRTDLLLTAPTRGEMFCWFFALYEAAFGNQPQDVCEVDILARLNGGISTPFPHIFFTTATPKCGHRTRGRWPHAAWICAWI